MIAVLHGAAAAQEPAVTVLADFEGASVAAQLVDFRGLARGDCSATRTAIPARGQGALAIEIGATAADVSVACDLTFREPRRLALEGRVGAYCWVNEQEVGLAYRLRDARGRLFETPRQTVKLDRRWVFVPADLKLEALQGVQGSGGPVPPIEIQGFRVFLSQVGRQTVYLDDLQIEHVVRPSELVLGEFRFDEPTQLYEPGASVAAALELENRSRSKALTLGVDLAWTRPDGSVLQTQKAEVTLPPSGVDFRSRRTLDFSQRIREPGLYRLVAQARAPGWPAPSTFSTTIAVTPSNRRVSRGRATFFAVRSNLLREPDLDQRLEVDVARDIGVNLLALDARWRLLEPKAGVYETAALEPLVGDIVQKDMAALLVLNDPPEWLPADTDRRVEPLAALVSALAARFGERLYRFQIGPDVLPRDDFAALLEDVATVRTRVSRTAPKAEVLPPPLPVDSPAALDIPALRDRAPETPLVFATRGNTALALAALDELRARGQFSWRATDWWLHDAEPLASPGDDADAEAVLRHYVAAAAAGVGGLIWFDLRDDDNDPARPEGLRGLVCRDFSPKTRLLGYASTAGMLTGYRAAGPVRGTPATFDSALFIGANRQVAVLLPKANVVLPAVLSPAAGVPGEFAVQDFERRRQTVLTSSAPPLVPIGPRPLFITLTTKQAESDPQLTLARPWLRAPGLVFAGDEFAVEVEAPRALKQSYLQIRLPKNSPIESSVSAAALKAEAGETTRVDIRLTPKAGQPFERAEVPLRVALEGSILEIPIEVRPAVVILPAGGSILDEAHRVCQLVPPATQRATARVWLHAGFSPDTLQLALVVEDDKLIPFTAGTGREAGDQIQLGIARAGTIRHAQVRIDPAAEHPRIEPLRATAAERVAGWQVRVQPGTPSGGGGSVGAQSAAGAANRSYLVLIPAADLGAAPLGPGDQILLAVRYVDDDADAFPAVPLSWGSGLDRNDATRDYQWLRLGGP